MPRDDDDEAAFHFLEDLWLPGPSAARWGFALGSRAYAMRPALLRGGRWTAEGELTDAEAVVVERFAEGSAERCGEFDLIVIRPGAVRLNAQWAAAGPPHPLKDEDELSTAAETVLFRAGWVA